MNAHSQHGLVCVSSVDDYENDVIKKHEFTRPDKELDRINHIKTTGAQTGNVFLAYRDSQQLNELISKCIRERSPIYLFTADDAVEHAVWVITDSSVIENITRLFGEISNTYIADGHHRAASAAKVRQALAGKKILMQIIFSPLYSPHRSCR